MIIVRLKSRFAASLLARARQSSRKVGNGYFLGRKYPRIAWAKLNGIFNRTMTFRRDADVVVTHGEWNKYELMNKKIEKIENPKMNLHAHIT